MYLIVRHTRLLCVLQKREFITIKDRRKLFVLRRKLRCKRKKESVYMSLTQIQKLQLNKQVDRILHAPGNQPTGNQQLEMAFVFDASIETESIKTTAQDTVAALKAHDKIFQNVRSNVVYWGVEKICTEAMPMSFIQIGKPFVEWGNRKVDKSPKLDELCAYLKLYHARSKCIILFTQADYELGDKKKVKESLNPFLKHKLLVVTPDKMITGTNIFMELIRE